MTLIVQTSTPFLQGIDRRHLQQVSLPVVDPTQVSETRRSVAERTAALRFSTRTAGEAAIVVTEMAGNLIRHGGGGEVLLRTLTDGNLVGIEMLALDRGRGMDLATCLVDGYSTGGSPGTGLGAIRRLSASSDFYSGLGAGSAVLSTIWGGAVPDATSHWLVGGINVPLPGQEICGDLWAARAHDGGVEVLMVDGLGHGPEAAKASMAAAGVFHDRARCSPSEQLEAADRALESTRGAAMGVTVIDLHRGNATFAGIGNTVAVVATHGKSQHLVSFGGIVGQRNLHHREFTVPWSPDSVFIAHSDGIGTRWSLDSYPALTSRHPSIVAGVLYRDFGRNRDDASVVVVRRKG